MFLVVLALLLFLTLGLPMMALPIPFVLRNKGLDVAAQTAGAGVALLLVGGMAGGLTLAITFGFGVFGLPLGAAITGLGYLLGNLALAAAHPEFRVRGLAIYGGGVAVAIGACVATTVLASTGSPIGEGVLVGVFCLASMWALAGGIPIAGMAATLGTASRE